MKRFFHNELDTLRSHLMLMGEKANEAVYKSIKGLIEKDIDLVNHVIASDEDIDTLEVEIDYEATRYLTLRAPVASDLRLMTVAIKASHDLERVGDEARNIAKRARKIILKHVGYNEFQTIPDMAIIAQEMLRDALQSFLHEETDRAYRVMERDEEVDQLNKSNIKAFIRKAKDEPELINRFLDLIFISKSLERIADHATNLAEEVVFLTTATETRHKELPERIRQGADEG